MFLHMHSFDSTQGERETKLNTHSHAQDVYKQRRIESTSRHALHMLYYMMLLNNNTTHRHINVSLEEKALNENRHAR